MNPLILLSLRVTPAERQEFERLRALLARTYGTEDEQIRKLVSSFRAYQPQTNISDTRVHEIYRQLRPGMNAQERRLAEKTLQQLRSKPVSR